MGSRRNAWARPYETDAKVLREMHQEARSQGNPGSRDARPYYRVLRMMCHHLEGLGYTQAAIAEVMGVSRENVRQLIASAKGMCWWPPEAPAPKCPPVYIGMPKRLGGNPAVWPRVPIPDEDKRRLRRLRNATRGLNGSARSDDPRRKQARQLVALMADLIRRHHLPDDIAKAMGVTRAAVDNRLVSYGHKEGRASVRKVVGYGSREPRPAPRTRIRQVDINDALKELWG